jgi:hypothetical protein
MPCAVVHRVVPPPARPWGRKARLGDQTWEEPVLAQVAGIALDDASMASVVASLGSNQQPVAIDRARTDRQVREVALEHAGGLLGDDTYLVCLKALLEQREAHCPGPTRPSRGRVAARPRRVHPVRIRVAGLEIVGVRLTAAALRPRIGAGAARRACNGAPDRYRARDFNLHHPDRGAG